MRIEHDEKYAGGRVNGLIVRMGRIYIPHRAFSFQDTNGLIVAYEPNTYPASGFPLSRTHVTLTTSERSHLSFSMAYKSKSKYRQHISFEVLAELMRNFHVPRVPHDL